MDDILVILKNLEATRAFAQKFKDTLKGDEIILLEGELGVGKTTFTQLLAKELGINKIVKSPSYTIIADYHADGVDLEHFDLYRIETDNLEYAEPTIYDQITNGKGIKIIEWPKSIESFLPKYIKITFSIVEDDARKIVIGFVGF
jgi:tRNA threonylcarbamoyladenosine biosynthesis protein TsaE